MRKFWFAYLAKAVIVFPGGFGTLDELFELLTLVQTRKMSKPMPIVLFGTEYWGEVRRLRRSRAPWHHQPEDIDLVHRTDSVDDAYEWIVKQLSKRRWGSRGDAVACGSGARSPAPRPRWPRLELPFPAARAAPRRQRPGPDHWPRASRAGRRLSSRSGAASRTADWNDPHVLKVGAEYWMYASSNLGFPPAPNSPSRSTAFNLARRRDLDAQSGDTGPERHAATWDQGGNETPSGRVLSGASTTCSGPVIPMAGRTSTRSTSRSATPPPPTGLRGPRTRRLCSRHRACGEFQRVHRRRARPGRVQQHLYLYFTAVGVDSGLARACKVRRRHDFRRRCRLNTTGPGSPTMNSLKLPGTPDGASRGAGVLGPRNPSRLEVAWPILKLSALRFGQPSG